jgi:hypothetical protein
MGRQRKRRPSDEESGDEGSSPDRKGGDEVRWRQLQVFVAAARLVVEVLRLLHDHIVGGVGPGRPA